jgi:hypothetical protein
MRIAPLALLVLLPLCLASCGPATHGPAKMPTTFLHTPSPAWTQWLDSETHYGSFTNFAVRGVLVALAGPADLKIAPSPALDRTAPHIDLATLTVRQALWKVSSEYGVTIALATTYEPRTFLDLLETESKRDGPGGATTMTEVMQGDPARYEKLKAAKGIYREEVQGDTLFYAVQHDRCLPFPGGVSAMIIAVERYKIPATGRPPTPGVK